METRKAVPTVPTVVPMEATLATETMEATSAEAATEVAVSGCVAGWVPIYRPSAAESVGTSGAAGTVGTAGTARTVAHGRAQSLAKPPFHQTPGSRRRS